MVYKAKFDLCFLSSHQWQLIYPRSPNGGFVAGKIVKQNEGFVRQQTWLGRIPDLSGVVFFNHPAMAGKVSFPRFDDQRIMLQLRKLEGTTYPNISTPYG